VGRIAGSAIQIRINFAQDEGRRGEKEDPENASLKQNKRKNS